MWKLNFDNKNKQYVYLLAIGALLLGILFDYLFFEKFFGISFFIFESILLILTYWFSDRSYHIFRPALWLFVIALFFAAMVAVRANPFLTFLNVVASMGLLLLATQELRKKPIINFQIPDYIRAILVTPLLILRRSLQALTFLSRSPEKSSSAVFKRVIVGVIMALPFLIIFGALFTSADLAFKQLVDSIFRFQIPDEFFGHVVLIVGVFVVCLGIFAYLFNVPPEKEFFETPENSKLEKDTVDRNIEIRVFLWLIAGLFAVFLIFQIAYLFGGVINISQSTFTYAEYARKGFWELLTVAFFTLLILLIMDRYTRFKGPRVGWFTVPSLVLIGEIFIIIISAFKRLMLYQAAYGLTTLRLYVAGFIIFLGVIFILLAVKLWREQEDRFFVFGTLLSMIAFVVVFNILNPDVFIAQQNINHFSKTGKIDAQYLGSMSADAVPIILSVYDRFNDEDKTTIDQLIVTKKKEIEERQSQWQSYNLSQHRALIEIYKRPSN